MDDKDRINLEFQHLLYKRNNLTTILIVMVSGVIGLIYNINHPFSVVLLFVGIPFIMFIFKGLLNIEDSINCFIKKDINK